MSADHQQRMIIAGELHFVAELPLEKVAAFPSFTMVSPLAENATAPAKINNKNSFILFFLSLLWELKSWMNAVRDLRGRSAI